MLSFISHVKIGPGYEDFKERALYYINHIHYFCKKHNISYEIIIIEHVDDANIFLLYKNIHNLITADIQVKIIAIDINSYPNKFRFNMNEYNGINIGLLNAKEKFVVVNSIDIIYDETFFTFIKSIKTKTLYRLTTYSIKDVDTSNTYYEKHQLLFKKNITHRHFPPATSFHPRFDLGVKSGDIMLLDRQSWLSIRGTPFGNDRHHVDFSTILVITNNYNTVVPDKKICIYTKEQKIHDGGEKTTTKMVIPIPFDNEKTKYIRYEKYINGGHDGKMLFNPKEIVIKKDGKAYAEVDTHAYYAFLQWNSALKFRFKKKSNDISIEETIKDITIL